MMDVIAFYSHRKGNPYREFSNFYEHAFDYQLPSWKSLQPDYAGTVLRCEFAEKTIMLTKAALMNDLESFEKIAKAGTPFECKRLGRLVSPFNESVWRHHLDHVAFEVLRQKFESSSNLESLLLSTNDAILAEASPTDRIWGIGVGLMDPRRHLDPSQWPGLNVLGISLMRVRHFLRNCEIQLKPLE